MASDKVALYSTPPTRDLLRVVIAIVDPRVPLPMIAAMLSALLPATRVDVLFSDLPTAMQLFLTAGDDRATITPPTALASGAAFVEWLAGLGYRMIERFPMIDTMQLSGWFVLSCTEGELDSSQRSLVTELANAFVLRHIAVKREIELQHTRASLSDVEARLERTEQAGRQTALVTSTLHDLNTMLAAIVGHAQSLQHDAPLALRDNLGEITRAAEDSALIVRRLLTRDYMPMLPSAPVTLVTSVVREAITLTRPFWECFDDLSVTTDLHPVPAVLAEPTDIREVLVNLILNAIAAMPNGGTLTLASAIVRDEVNIVVSDTGEGIAREYQGAIFAPLETLRANGGVGITVSRAIIERVGGQLTIAGAPGHGATYTIALPIAPVRDADSSR
jgi:signal transduction histidine kinase